jgi:predicted MFS family arabinose efflux permease
VPALGAAAIQQGFAASYERTALLLLLVPGLVSLVVEPFIFVLADRYPRKAFVCGGLFAMAAAAIAAALAPTFAVLAGAVSVAYVAAGSGVALSQATLIDAAPDQAERMMTRWTLLGEVGDLAGPAMMAALAWLGLGWRAAYAIVGVLVAIWAVAILRRPFPIAPRPSDDEASGPSPWRNRRLLLWSFAEALCNFLDEILVVFASLHLRDDLGAGPVARSVVLGAYVAGAILGLAITDRLLRRIQAMSLLALSGAACTLLYLAWLAMPSVWLSAPMLLLVGVAAAPLYPLCSAQSYAVLPGRSGAVQAVGHLYTPMVMATPWLLGWLADRAGTVSALLVLTAQPLLIAVIAVAVLAHQRRRQRLLHRQSP